MEYIEFKKELLEKATETHLNISEKEMQKFYKYMELLLEWNEKINLTAITEPSQIIEKHFIDSLTILKYLENSRNIIDIGTGAGFPGIPLAIASKCQFTLLDSLNKRVNFLNEIKENLELNNVVAEHGRAEDFGKRKEYREKFDIAVSRAVAPMNILLEYLLPFVKVGGKCICMKGPKVEEELKGIENVLKILGGQIEKIDEINIAEGEMSRKIIIIKKIHQTPAKYPRKAGTPQKEPLK